MTSTNHPENVPEPGGFAELPLRGQTILVTRAIEQAKSLQKPLERLGATVLFHPVIRIVALDEFAQLDECIARLKQFDRVVFVSRNAARFFVDRVKQLDRMEELLQLSMTAIGPSSAGELKSLTGFESVDIPDEFNSLSLANRLLNKAVGERLLVIRANRGSDVLPKTLTESKANFEQVIAYQSTDVDKADPSISQQMVSGTIDWVTLTSPAIARSSYHLFGDMLRQCKLVSISPTTSQAIRANDMEPTAEATKYDMEGVVAAILESTNAT